MDEKRMRELINELANTYSDRRPMMLDVLQQTHRTVQQSFTALCLAWINELSKSGTDARNKASAEVCRKLVKAYCEMTGEDKIPDRFPMI